MKISVCDDISVYGEYTASIVAEHLKKCREAEIRIFSTATDLLEEMRSGYSPDIAILDIKMQEMDGISLAKEINTIASECSIIFLTAYLNYAPDVYDARHTYFVLKSQIQERLPLALNQALKKVLDQQQTIILETQEVLHQIVLSDILFLERVLRKTKIVTIDAEYWTTKKPDELLRKIGHPLIRCHQSYYVNINYVSLLNKDGFLLKNGAFVPVSRAYKHTVKDYLLFYNQ